MSNNSSPDVFKRGFLVLGVLAAIGLAGYGLTYIIVMPGVSPDAFVPASLEAGADIPAQFGMIQVLFALLYAFAFLPVSVMFTIRRYRDNPYALVLAGCVICTSLLIEIFNSLPLLAAQIYPGQLASISPEVRLYLGQVESIRFLAYDVAGFTLAYVAIFIYALVYFRTRRWLAYAIIGSIVLFIANVPFLWLTPNLAVILMALSVLAFATVPIALARLAIE